jgi:hypothetical protein
MTKLISAAKEVHNLQVDKATSIDAIRTQYFKLDEALASHELLEETTISNLGYLNFKSCW